MVVSPAPARAAARAAMRAAPVIGIAAEQQGMTAGVFVAAAAAARAAARAKARDAFSQVSTAMRSSALSGVPISATTMVSAQTRPGSSRCPGFLRVKVTVHCGGDGAERFAGIPHDAARHVDGDDGQAALGRRRENRARPRRRAGGSSPNRTAHRRRSSAPSSARGSSGSSAPLQRAAWCAASPRRRSRGPKSATRTGQPRAASALAATKPSPPLLPGPHSTTTGRADQRRTASRATARPARCMSRVPGVPDAAVNRSASCICATRSSAHGAAALPAITPPLRRSGRGARPRRRRRRVFRSFVPREVRGMRPARFPALRRCPRGT